MKILDVNSKTFSKLFLEVISKNIWRLLLSQRGMTEEKSGGANLLNNNKFLRLGSDVSICTSPAIMANLLITWR